MGKLERQKGRAKWKGKEYRLRVYDFLAFLYSGVVSIGVMGYAKKIRDMEFLRDEMKYLD